MTHRTVSRIIAKRPVVSIGHDGSVADAARIMTECRVGSLLVLDDHGRLSGIFTERDLLSRVVAQGRVPARTRVEQVMTREPRTISPAIPFGHAMHIMHEGGFRHVPVVDHEGRPLGVVSARDALSQEMAEFEGELEQRERITVLL